MHKQQRRVMVLTEERIDEEGGRGELCTCGWSWCVGEVDRRGSRIVNLAWRWSGRSCVIAREALVKRIAWRWTVGGGLLEEELGGAVGKAAVFLCSGAKCERTEGVGVAG